ncbi:MULTISPECIES: serine/threonine-protein kinase [Streptosporangium]|uniref:non-specific serine/threonine protein kinase n=1 Tax=Streptosporangium brasiliense TaxID=47480 RepID=A0ABT9QY23_9ACTN|nr:serine/threonine-protein kinase [Streptosporangium brasiliense]MDP9861869.1 serine/threonine protein kinase [Streptosporangium brasiliense]
MTDSQGIIGARYRLLEHIGRGGMGTVWRARDEVLGRDVAVKEVIPSPDLTGPEREVFTVRTLREARAAGRIGHPGVATVYDVIEEHGRPWIVMQLVDSRTLGAVVREDGPLPPARTAQIGLEVLGALLAAHQAGVLHRDVKPDNVLLSKDGRAVLTDFGIAVLEGDSSVTRTGALIGTPAFIAPERASGGPAEFASDLWSLGVTLYMAVEGRSPFERAHPLATLSAVMHEEPAPLRFAGSLGPVISGLLRKDPAQRMSAQEVQVHLRAIVNGTEPQPTMPIVLPAPAPAPASAPAPAPAAAPVGAPAPEPDPLVAAGRRRRRPAVAALAATAVAAVLTSGGAAWVALNSAPTQPVKGPTTASVPAEKDTPDKNTEQARLPTERKPSPARTGSGRQQPSARPTTPEQPRHSSPSPSDGPTGDRPEDGSGKGSKDDSGKDSGKGSKDDTGKDSEQDSGKKPGKDSQDAPDDGSGQEQGQGPDDGAGESSGGTSGDDATQDRSQEGTEQVAFGGGTDAPGKVSGKAAAKHGEDK